MIYANGIDYLQNKSTVFYTKNNKERRPSHHFIITHGLWHCVPFDPVACDPVTSWLVTLGTTPWTWVGLNLGTMTHAGPCSTHSLGHTVITSTLLEGWVLSCQVCIYTRLTDAESVMQFISMLGIFRRDPKQATSPAVTQGCVLCWVPFGIFQQSCLSAATCSKGCHLFPDSL